MVVSRRDCRVVNSGTDFPPSIVAAAAFAVFPSHLAAGSGRWVAVTRNKSGPGVFAYRAVDSRELQPPVACFPAVAVPRDYRLTPPDQNGTAATG